MPSASASGHSFADKSCINRLQKEYRALLRDPVPDIIAHPCEKSILEWHYVLKGSPESPYEGGVYHGKVVFPSEYPYVILLFFAFFFCLLGCVLVFCMALSLNFDPFVLLCSTHFSPSSIQSFTPPYFLMMYQITGTSRPPSTCSRPTGDSRRPRACASP